MSIFDFFKRKQPAHSGANQASSEEQKPDAVPEVQHDHEAALAQVRACLRSASVAQIGGFRPPDDPCTSWFGRAVGMPGEGLPLYKDETMFPLLQVNIAELPFVPPQLQEVALLVLFHNRREHPFDEPHGSGWLIREYSSLQGLVPLPEAEAPLRPFPIRWSLVEDDAPGWEDSADLIDQAPFLDDESLSDAFFDDFNRYSGTKVGGYPDDIQHGVGVEDFVFQVGSEEKAQWMWADNGIGYFFKSPDGKWSWKCQFY